MEMSNKLETAGKLFRQAVYVVRVCVHIYMCVFV